MFSYRSTVAAMKESPVTVAIEGGSGSGDGATTTSVTLSEVGLTDTSTVVDVKVATLGVNLFARGLKGTAGTATGRDSNGGKGSPDAGLAMRLRSKPTIVEVSLQGATEPFAVEDLQETDAVKVTMPILSDFQFNTSFGAYKRLRSCETNGAPVALDCPLDPTTTHVCNFAAHGNGGKYFFEYSADGRAHVPHLGRVRRGLRVERRRPQHRLCGGGGLFGAVRDLRLHAPCRRRRAPHGRRQQHDPGHLCGDGHAGAHARALGAANYELPDSGAVAEPEPPPDAGAELIAVSDHEHGGPDHPTHPPTHGQAFAHAHPGAVIGALPQPCRTHRQAEPQAHIKPTRRVDAAADRNRGNVRGGAGEAAAITTDSRPTGTQVDDLKTVVAEQLSVAEDQISGFTDVYDAATGDLVTTIVSACRCATASSCKLPLPMELPTAGRCRSRWPCAGHARERHRDSWEATASRVPSSRARHRDRRAGDGRGCRRGHDHHRGRGRPQQERRRRGEWDDHHRRCGGLQGASR